ncbi:multisubunit potassium/proton antiporter PhaA subunit /multisubunit potassium/proton antiporter PhaB subunit [Paraburkholderia caballeronis]|uniref:monovalent cation/H+ antiporter subunit A n=1 Tax=Paraburkholderia caballeronis TaxID=416943 RepID=UPI001066BF90|nr:monovalent cation/H+ antiporter subunit A [Paraburkholderia caballeronis]TDV34311.1 multisubunit potassium/proton antiporter PhaA subunit /multisubunit potassium/proton antiporter PhaB subunit [Paraburkholderia caballeronis]
MTLPLLVALPFVAAALIAAAMFAMPDGVRVRALSPWFAFAAPLVGLGLLVSERVGMPAAGVLAWRRPWVPGLGLTIGLRLDGLSYLFALLVLAIGLLVFVYARYYLANSESMPRLYVLLLLFMGSMLGLVLSDNLLLLAIFWELTSVVSFLLIGFWPARADARRGARMSLSITAAGGLALLAGVLLLGHICGSLELADVLAQAGRVQHDPLYPAMLLLILFAAFTKSAQFPFHFWLPHAMSAPTPVSAYLHSATMVKAGVFLLARLYPVLDGTDEWFYIVSLTGLVTLAGGAAMALVQRDLKGLLAYSTISHLGLIMLLFGLDTQLSTVAALFHTINHAVFKASLFMAAGIIDHETGTRDLGQLRGLRRYMPHTALLAIVASLAMAGVPLLNGFLSKEMFFGETLAQGLLGEFNWVIPTLALCATALSVAYSLRFVYGVFFDGATPRDLPQFPPHEPPRFMKLPVEILVVVCLLIGLFPQFTIGTMLEAAARVTLGGPPPDYSLSLWHGVNAPLTMSVVSFAAGVLLFAFRRDAFRRHRSLLSEFNASEGFDVFVGRLERAARPLVRLFESGSLPSYLAWMIGAMLVVPGLALSALAPFAGPAPRMPVDPVTLAGLALLAALAIGVVLARATLLVAIVLLGSCGLLVTLAFARFSAPDLALTQISVEIVTVLLLVLALYFLPAVQRAPDPAAARIRNAALAIAGGALVGGVAYAVLTRAPLPGIAPYFLANALGGSGGHNVVNVILVDFRGFDTLVEISVLVVAGLAVKALLRGLRLAAPKTGPRGLPWSSQSHPLLLAILARLMLPLTALVAVFVFLRGHNLPGGGFVAALVASIALLLQYVASGVLWTESRIRINYRSLAGLGILCAALTGLGSLAFGYPFLTSAFGHLHLPLVGEIELSTAMLFDLGVFGAVVGTTLTIVSHLGVRDKNLQSVEKS